ncbi:hypothetical protein [Streptomyces capillispiralis]|uniref:Uncharacterized protein n=1 Tax=Streptomyces capillispiralis TaxID=68182 RepID=A0A561SGY0_9ACTN|nr:hypothetical protein [Streptomyces capillispiralis]TWF74118.1 hypothetical protein FHX78_12150 [Streptomyces capillispiralis]GHE23980.1 hypothetical protein GCM10017779_70480 [Streptomyces capillispiralis]
MKHLMNSAKPFSPTVLGQAAQSIAGSDLKKYAAYAKSAGLAESSDLLRPKLSLTSLSPFQVSFDDIATAAGLDSTSGEVRSADYGRLVAAASQAALERRSRTVR